MLGVIDRDYIVRLMQCLVDGDVAAAMTTVASIAGQAPDYQSILAELISMLHRLAICQAIPDSLDNMLGDKTQLLAWAKQLTAENVQLLYQVALIGRRDLAWSPDLRSGFEMTLLRMLLFKPEEPKSLIEGAGQPALGK